MRFQTTGRLAALALLLPLALAGCDAAGPSLDAAVAAPADARGSRWVHNVTGGGANLYPYQTNGFTFTMTFNARADDAGNAEGRVSWRFPDGRLASEGDVYCLEVRGNRAFMSYRATGGELDGYGTPGASVSLAFEDNGEGANSPLDRQSYIYFGSETADCANFANFVEGGFGFPVKWVRGNVQVR